MILEHTINYIGRRQQSLIEKSHKQVGRQETDRITERKYARKKEPEQKVLMLDRESQNRKEREESMSDRLSQNKYSTRMLGGQRF